MNQEQLLKDGAKELGIILNEVQIKQFIKYKELLVEWNSKMNLTTITEDMEVITKHFLDCLTIYKCVDISKVNTIIDVGTGAGFPGLVIKIAFPNIKMTLVDSLKKRLNFLEEVIKELKLDKVECIHSRAEDLGNNKDYRGKYDVCVSRAVANLAVLSEYTMPFVKVNGYLVALKGMNLDQELEKGRKAINILGGKIDSIIDAKVPFTDLNHKIVRVKIVKKMPNKYPRKAGEPRKIPLGE